jgi:flagellar basal-body rod protein FlgG
MDAQQTQLEVTANNIANVSTPGYKKSRVEFQDLMVQTLRAPGAATGAGTTSPSGLEVGLGARVAATQRMHSEGDLRQTGNPLDLAIEGQGFFAVTLPSGDTAYTRSGALKLDAEGRLVNSDGFPIAGDIAVPPDAQSITVAADGTVSAQLPGQAAAASLGRIELVSFANPGGLSAMGRNLFRETSASGTPVTGKPGEAGRGTLSQGTLELSNVKVVEEMMDLISGQRAYEISAKVIKAADEMLQQTANLR